MLGQFSMLNQRLLSRIEDKKSKLDSLRPLPAAALNRLKEQFTVEWIYNSNAIEGSTLTLRETKLILETGLTIGGKSLREHFEVTNHKDAIEFLVRGHADLEFTAYTVLSLHALLSNNLLRNPRSCGQLRSIPVGIAHSNYQPPDIPLSIKIYFRWIIFR